MLFDVKVQTLTNSSFHSTFATRFLSSSSSSSIPSSQTTKGATLVRFVRLLFLRLINVDLDPFHLTSVTILLRSFSLPVRLIKPWSPPTTSLTRNFLATAVGGHNGHFINLTTIFFLLVLPIKAAMTLMIAEALLALDHTSSLYIHNPKFQVFNPTNPNGKSSLTSNKKNNSSQLF